MECSEIMTPSPDCCVPTTSVDQVAQLMEAKDVGPVPVIDEFHSRHLVGIVTDRDLAIRVVGKDRDPKTTPVQEVMSASPCTCKATDSIDKVLELMEQHQVRRMPVVDDQNRLIGIIAQSDIAMRLAQPQKTQELVEKVSHPQGGEIPRH